MSRIKEVDGLRGIALLSVLLYHGRFHGFFHGGFLGVDIFFVISGYVITLSLRRSLSAGHFSFSEFILRRAYRLLPSLIATILVGNSISSLIFTTPYRKEAAKLSIYSILSISNIHLWLETGYFDTHALLKLYLHTWSLSVEWQFYILWAIICRFALSRKHSITRNKFALWFIAISSLITTETLRHRFPSATFYLCIPRIFEFMSGCIPAWILYDEKENQITSETVTSKKTRNKISWLAFLCIIFYQNWFRTDYAFPGASIIPVCISTTLLILKSKDTSVGILLCNPVLQLLGKISYSVYLVHWPILVFIEYQSMSQSSSNIRAIGVVCSIFIGWLLNVSIEIPFQKRKSGREFRTKHLTFMFSFLLLLLQAFIMNIDKIPIGPTYFVEKDKLLSKVLENTNNITSSRKFDDRRRCTATRRFHNLNHFEECNSESEDEYVTIGDSHALDIWYALKETNPNKTIIQLTGTACTFGYEFGKGGHCDDLFSHIPKLLKGRENRISRVYIASRWPHWGESKKVSFAPLKGIISYFKTSTKAFIFVFGPRPEIDPPPHEIAVRSLDFDLSSIDNKAQGYFILNTRGNQVLEDNLADSRTCVIPTTDLMCEGHSTYENVQDKLFCSTLNENRTAFIYSDRHHYNKEGALKLLRKLKNFDCPMSSNISKDETR